ncbi:MAG: hypothetical protein PHV68_06560 [Candidatus Gastranaerophilales bacterium]|nr:hypothetical protein [Candidatus Gastranaerophilales bacterium]
MKKLLAILSLFGFLVLIAQPASALTYGRGVNVSRAGMDYTQPSIASRQIGCPCGMACPVQLPVRACPACPVYPNSTCPCPTSRFVSPACPVCPKVICPCPTCQKVGCPCPTCQKAGCPCPTNPCQICPSATAPCPCPVVKPSFAAPIKPIEKKEPVRGYW